MGAENCTNLSSTVFYFPTMFSGKILGSPTENKFIDISIKLLHYGSYFLDWKLLQFSIEIISW